MSLLYRLSEVLLLMIILFSLIQRKAQFCNLDHIVTIKKTYLTDRIGGSGGADV